MDRLPPLRLLMTFEAVARLGSMRQAATRLNVSQSAVSQALKALDDHVGAALFDRSTRPASLTEAGQILSTATREGLGQISAALEDIRGLLNSEDQQVTVACTVGMATYWLMPKLAAFYDLYPNISVNVQAPSTDLPVLAPGIDVAIRYGKGGWSDGNTDKLFSEKICPVGTPTLVEKLLEDGVGLDRAPLIHVRNPNNPHWASWDEYLRKRGLTGRRNVGPSYNNYVQASQAAMTGRGLMLGWRSITGSAIEDGLLVAWPEGEADLETAYYVTSPNRLSQSGQCFVDWLTGLFKTN